jgi:hypothetical protein
MKSNKKILFTATLSGIIFFITCMNVSATVLNTLSNMMSSLKISNLSNHEISFISPTGVQAGETVILTFPNGFSIPAGFTFADVDINIGGQYVGSSTLGPVPSGLTVGVVRSAANVITITNGTSVIPGGSILNIKIGTNATHDGAGTFQITNDTTVGSKAISIDGSFGDNGTTTVILLSDDSVQVLAVVPQSFTFSVSANTINFGSLSTASAKYASSTNSGGDSTDTEAHNLTIATNANAGYTITLQGGTLTSQQNALNTISPNGNVPIVSSPGSEQFGIYATKSGGGNGVIDSTYATVSSFGYNSSAISSAALATASSANGTLEVYHLHYIANISALTEAGSYSTSIVYVGTSNF